MQRIKLKKIIAIIACIAIFATFVESKMNLKKITNQKIKLEKTISDNKKKINLIETENKSLKRNKDFLEKQNKKIKEENTIYKNKNKELQDKLNKIGTPMDF